MSQSFLLPKALRLARQMTGMSQATLAEKANISPSYVAMIELGLRVPGPEPAARIAAALGVDLDTFLLEKP